MGETREQEWERFRKTMAALPADIILLNSRSFCKRELQKSPNWVVAMKIFGLGSTFARMLCLEHGFDPDGSKFQRPAPEAQAADDEFYYVADFRPEWRGKRYVTFWRPKNAGYAFPLPWAGRYTRAEIENGGGYYTKREGRRYVRCAIRCSIVEAMGVAPEAGDIDGDVGLVVLKTAANRKALVASRLRPVSPAPDVGGR
ncbi:hypothetical protein [Kaistia defluvii]|uniref:Uncharacterized protein n=1 Tax=Kaistia defluvii TaxID=410841 RepID=A0ABV2R4L3_9HYPH